VFRAAYVLKAGVWPCDTPALESWSATDGFGSGVRRRLVATNSLRDIDCRFAGDGVVPPELHGIHLSRETGRSVGAVLTGLTMCLLVIWVDVT